MAMIGWTLSWGEQSELWQLWRQGVSVRDISRALRCRYGLAHKVVCAHGGIAPLPSRRAARSLNSAQREEISRGLSAQMSLRQIARRICKAPSSISREVRRNGGTQRYRASKADSDAWRRARRPKRCLLAREPRLCREVARGLKKCWSPQQIAQRLQEDFPNDQTMRVSHETIYRSLFIQSRGVLKKQLVAHLRRRRPLRRSRRAAAQAQAENRGQVVHGLSIRERPAEAEDRAVPGHWEGDLISGRNNSHIATLVERHSRFVMLVKVASKDTLTVTGALAQKMRKLPAELRRSLTWDRGAELTAHQQFTLASDMQVYFCDPQSPWQRGSNENTNGLLRQYFPKGTDLSVHSQARLNTVANELNQRPRQTLNFRTPAEKLAETVASTG
jgi:IS30 family transposase